MSKWTSSDMPALDARVAVVTGATSGIGEAAASDLAARGAHVVLAVRDAAKGEMTKSHILRRTPSAKVTLLSLDLADLASIREFAERANRTLPQVDILLNNAGLGMQPRRSVTKDGFERQFGTNHLGSFALTGLLLPVLLKAPAPRVVAISSIAHRFGSIRFDDLQGQRAYKGADAYNQSKLANLMFMLELDRRARASGSRLISVAAHPGVAKTAFLKAAELPRPAAELAGVGVRLFGQSAERGALPGLYAATMPDVHGGEYFGPSGFQELRGAPKRAAISARARDGQVAQRLWSESERMTGVTYRLS